MSKSVLVVGGGIAGIQASLDLANRGTKVYLIEETPSIGGHMAQLDKTFPTLDCSICILAPKMIECLRHNNISLLTYSEVKEVKGQAGDFTVKIFKKPRFVDEKKCTGCGECAKVCPVTSPNEFDEGLGARNAIYRPFAQAVPNVFVIDKRGTPPCRAACPAGVNAQGYVALIAKKKFKEALELVRKDNPFPSVCGRICFHPCEKECERGKLDLPIAIKGLKRFVADYELKQEPEAAEPAPLAHAEKVAVIGSGPAGLTAAYQLRHMGYPVTVFESLSQPGGMLRVSIPEYRLPKNILDIEIQHIKNSGIEIRTNMQVGKDIKMEDIAAEYAATFIAVGVQSCRRLGISGEELVGVVPALVFLKQAIPNAQARIGEKVVVVGGGNVAIDAARMALRRGAKEVTLLYRRVREEMPAYPLEVAEAEREGVKMQFLAAPKRIIAKDGRICAVECLRMELGEPDESGRRRPVPKENTEFTLDADAVVPAVGQALDYMSLPNRMQLSDGQVICVDPQTLETKIPGVFAGGDAVLGEATVIDAIAQGKRAAISIDRYLRHEDMRAGREEEPRETAHPLSDIEAAVKLVRQPREEMPLLAVPNRIGDHEVELGFTEEMAVAEASRCLSCGGCSECFECEKVCQPKALIHDQKEELVEINVGAIIVATGFVPSDPSGITAYGYRNYKNVLDSLQLERLLSASGPTGGHLIRPSDGNEPKSVVFVQCVGSRSQHGGFPFCSAVCCVYATKESIIIREHAPETQIYIMYIDMRAVGKNFQEFVDRARDEYGVKFIQAHPGRIKEDPATRNLHIHYEDTASRGLKALDADLVVLCPALIPREENKEIAKETGVELDEAGFFKAKNLLTAPLDTTCAGIYACGYCQGPKDIPESVAQASGAAARAAETIALHGKGGEQ